MKFSRNTIFLSGIAFLLLIYFAERLRFVVGAQKVTATFAMYVDESSAQEEIIYPIVEYTLRSKFTGTDTTYQFRGKENTKYEEGETVPVLLLEGNPDWPKLYSFGSFWLFPVVYYLLPLLLWSAFCFSYIDRKRK